MLSRRFLDRVASVVALLGFTYSVSASAATRPSTSPGTVPLPDVSSSSRDLRVPVASANSAAWQAFTSRHGPWSGIWNARTGTPHRVFGRGIRVAGAIDTPAQAAETARRFLVAEDAITKAAGLDLELRGSVRAGRVWYVHFRQRHDGVPILGDDITVRLWEDGRVVAFGCDARRELTLDVRPLLDAAAARILATEGLEFDVNADAVRGGDDLYILPVEEPASTRFALVRKVHVSQAEPPHEWVTMVDAHTGVVVWRYDRVRYGSVGGTVSGRVHASVPSDPLQDLPDRNLYVSVDGVDVFTGELGEYLRDDVAGPIDLDFQLRGRWGEVFRADGGRAHVVRSVDADLDPVVDLVWDDTNSHPDERHAYRNEEIAHAYVKSLDPDFTGLDYSMPVTVRRTGTCNAYWDGAGINFLRPKVDQCNAPAEILEVAAHEYGHAINDLVYVAGGREDGMTHGALHEALADITAAFLTDDPVIADEFFVDGRGIRNLDNERSYPFDLLREVHVDGLIVAGALWDLREAVGLDVAERLAHFARYGLADAPSDGFFYHQEVFSEYLVELLVADEDDGDLSNGSPHSTEILQAFADHGIAPSMLLKFNRIRVENEETPELPTQVQVDVFNVDSIGPRLDESSVRLHYRVDQGAWSTLPMARLNDPRRPDSFFVDMPPLPVASFVDFYYSAAVEGFPPVTYRLYPDILPEWSYVEGPPTILFQDDFRTDKGWTVGSPTDDATDAVWERGFSNWVRSWSSFPMGDTQPEADHTYGSTGNPPQASCYVTGAGFVLGEDGQHRDPNLNDVDGQTTLTSPVFDLSQAQHPVIEYVWWFSNNFEAAPGLDPWRAEISNDGGATWTSIHETTFSTTDVGLNYQFSGTFSYPPWWKMTFPVDLYVQPTGAVQIRFVIADRGEDSAVEGLVDDFFLRDYEEPVVANLVRSFDGAWRDGAVHLRWEAPAAIEGTLFELAGSAGTARWVVPYRIEAPGRYAATDVSAEAAILDVPNGSITSLTYELSRIDEESSTLGRTLLGKIRVDRPASALRTELHAPWPNPSNPVVNVSFAVAQRQPVRVGIYDLAGRQVAVLVDETLEAGQYRHTWNGRDATGHAAASGVYLLKLDAGRHHEALKLVLIR